MGPQLASLDVNNTVKVDLDKNECEMKDRYNLPHKFSIIRSDYFTSDYSISDYQIWSNPKCDVAECL